MPPKRMHTRTHGSSACSQLCAGVTGPHARCASAPLAALRAPLARAMAVAAAAATTAPDANRTARCLA
jgi:hypothetical protein